MIKIVNDCFSPLLMSEAQCRTSKQDVVSQMVPVGPFVHWP